MHARIPTLFLKFNWIVLTAVYSLPLVFSELTSWHACAGNSSPFRNGLNQKTIHSFPFSPSAALNSLEFSPSNPLAHTLRTPKCLTRFSLLTLVPNENSHDRLKDSTAENHAFKEIAEYLNQPEQELDVGLGNLLIGKKLNPEIDIKKYLYELDRLATDIKRKIRRKKNPEKVIRIINNFLYQQYGLTTESEAFPEDFLIHNLIDTKKGRCMSLVGLYLALSQRLDLNIVGVCIPEHIFARWIKKSKKGKSSSRKSKYINIETTLNGSKMADSFYTAMIANNSSIASNNFYMNPLTVRETIAAYLSPLGNALRKWGRTDEAIAACKLAIEINPKDAEAWNNLGMTYRVKGLKDMAMISYRKALEIYPDFAEAWHNMASIQDDNNKRIKFYKKVIALKPDLAEAWRNLVVAYCEKGNFELAWACVNRCRILGHRIPASLTKKIQRNLNSY